jgi:hypothetical protein
VEPHLVCGASDTAVHLGDRNGSPRLPLDLIEETVLDAGSEREHGARIAPRRSGNCHSFARKAHPIDK